MRFDFMKLICVVSIALFSAPAWAEEWTKDSLADVKKAVDDGKAVLVDVREKAEWDAGHIDGAISLPLSQMKDGISPEELSRLPKDKVLYVYCMVGKRALQGTELLKPMKVAAKALKPGYKELVEAGFPKAN